ncbi:MAG: chaperone NapD [Myxococcota bacterium]|jgi:nitrate reductase NapAB chaperone NapD|nr:chaperone NapD [Myxococcota bacterium]
MISGVVVASRPENLQVVSDAVDALPWAEVHYSDSAGRLVVTVEADGIDASIERVESLQRLPDVLSASLAEYRFEEGEMQSHPSSKSEPN